MKTYVLTVSRTFPATHKKKGENTEFLEKINCTLLCPGDCNDCKVDFETYKKIHTIRSNYELWDKRMKEVQEGNAIISLRYWSGKPYNSKQVEFAQLDYDSGCGVQELSFYWGGKDISCIIEKPFIVPQHASEIPPVISIDMIAKNDGLSLDDFKEWFKKYDLSKPMAIIHFTNFRY